MVRRLTLVSVIFMLVLSGITLISTACGPPAVCDVCGTYINQENPSASMRLKEDGTFYVVEEGEIGISGTWEIDGNIIILSYFMGLAASLEVHGNTLIDPDGIAWVKQ